MAERGELDLTGAKQNTGVWLVKVPKYLSQQWAKASGRGEVGKLRIAKNQGRTEVSFTLNEELANIHDIGGKPASVSAPREHPFLLQSVGGQTLTVFTESSSEGQPEENSESSNNDYVLQPNDIHHVLLSGPLDDFRSPELEAENWSQMCAATENQSQSSECAVKPESVHETQSQLLFYPPF
ncbi:general transcription factor IIF subunit 2-like [Dromiciops gliroides]|uniref:general transcription factor IIF subunit 2-like n=1 Tax=Dromiciops gliroides TaxID=33562 RepID=UPI001CC6EE7E|nr:general transcription factor IIF subunit 2-like [Dromiciops gliroides]